MSGAPISKFNVKVYSSGAPFFRFSVKIYGAGAPISKFFLQQENLIFLEILEQIFSKMIHKMHYIFSKIYMKV